MVSAFNLFLQFVVSNFKNVELVRSAMESKITTCTFHLYYYFILDLEVEFQDHLRNMFDEISDYEKLAVKKIDGKYATCEDLCGRMEAFASILAKDLALEDVHSIIQVKNIMLLRC